MRIDIIKRLKIIQEFISLEEPEMIESQIDRLSVDELDSHLFEIVSALKTNTFGKASKLIDSYLSNYSGVIEYKDPEITGLRMEIKYLELQITEFECKKAEFERLVHEFNIRYQRELGNLLDEILKLKKEKLKKEVKEDPKKKNAYKEAKEEYKKYHRIFEETKKRDVPSLSLEQQNELKNLFREASKICHPDVVAEEFQQEMKSIFIKLKSAYDNNCLDDVRDILSFLKKDKIGSLKSERISNKEQLLTSINLLKHKIEEIKKETELLKQSEPYQILSNNNWDEYFIEMKAKLKNELKNIKNLYYD